MNFNKILITLSILFCITSVTFAQEGLVLGNVFSQDAADFHAVVVEKSTNTLFLVDMKGDRPSVLRKLEVITGKNDSDKIKQGDLATPEGVYFIRRYISPDELDDAYGVLAEDYGTGAFPLNYPNIVDRINSKTGGGIWLHGMKEGREDNATKGCVAMENGKLDSLKGFLDKKTPVIITEKLNMMDEQAYNVERGMLIGNLKEHMQAWEDSDFETYRKFFHIHFKSTSGQSYAPYLHQKKKLMEIYPDRKVDISDIRVFKENDTEYVYDFNQMYCAPNIIAYGRKRLYLNREVDEFRIIAEEYRPGSSDDVVKESAGNFLVDWKKSWEGMDTERYIAHYSDSFSSDGMNRDSWRDDKAEKFIKYNDINVGIENIRVHPLAPMKVRVTFLQRFRGDSYSDVGIKTLVLEGCPGEYRILSEQWRPL
ncbi:L,D-transpeptidase family protein [Limisalsivibrio acetivorans]|uniref:L,D-transpeptidase family protein n=1 Tax=Limisalsivibrio acetivorans TaxID=1304888 RepID=UPI0003B6C8D6|nr:L,D-transpeptidase family protein [Limisalsivibrio acetivorans]